MSTRLMWSGLLDHYAAAVAATPPLHTTSKENR